MLIEAMAAIAMVAIMLAVTFRATGEDALNVRAADSSRTALLIARSRLAEASAAVPLEAGTSRGDDGAYRWTVTVEPEAETGSSAGALWHLTAIVLERGHTGVRAQLSTLGLSTFEPILPVRPTPAPAP